ncbi:hypothetical protein B0A55_07663 [Friedmanniomyces simplex]|uniref:Uncharacterized protein n=1 Tax=Friedmanniomyces simplex TaxID=329884 RepID=A0A4U0X681_9PEZI|nr:hypothetical protein B0A55_07663 [Friedmanniomyces simplex]
MIQIMYHGTVMCMSWGPSPKYWKLWLSHRGDLYAGIFWDMVEHPERAEPGVWTEPDDSDFPRREDWFNDQLRLRKEHLRARGRRQHSRHPYFPGQSDRYGRDSERRDEDWLEDLDEEGEDGGNASSHRPAFDYLHVDFNNPMLYFSLKANKVSIRRAVLAAPLRCLRMTAST